MAVVTDANWKILVTLLFGKPHKHSINPKLFYLKKKKLIGGGRLLHEVFNDQ